MNQTLSKNITSMNTNEKTKSLNEKQYLFDRDQFTLSLRKNNLNKYLNEKRKINFIEFQKPYKNYEIKISDLNLSQDIMNKNYSDLNNLIIDFKNSLIKNNLDLIQFYILLIRKKSIDFNCINFINEMYNKNIIEDLFKFLYNNYNNIKLSYEIIWIFINFTTYITDLNLYLFLSQKNNINIYIKIFDLNDNILNYEIIWLISHIFTYSELIKNFYFSNIIRDCILKNSENLDKSNKMNIYIYLKIFEQLTKYIHFINFNIKNNNIVEINKLLIDYPGINIVHLEENNNYLSEHITNFLLKNYNENESENRLLFLTNLLSLTSLENKKIINLIEYENFIEKNININFNKDEIINFLIILGNIKCLGKKNEIELDLKILNYIKKNFELYKNNQKIFTLLLWISSNIEFTNEKYLNYLYEINFIQSLLNYDSYNFNNLVEKNYKVIILFFSNYFYFEDWNFIQRIDKFKINIENFYDLFLNCLNKIKNNVNLLEEILTCFKIIFNFGENIKNITGYNIFVKNFIDFDGKNKINDLLIKIESSYISTNIENFFNNYFY